MFNPFGVAVTAYGQIWQFWAKKGHFWGVLGPPNAIFGGPWLVTFCLWRCFYQFVACFFPDRICNVSLCILVTKEGVYRIALLVGLFIIKEFGDPVSNSVTPPNFLIGNGSDY